MLLISNGQFVESPFAWLSYSINISFKTLFLNRKNLKCHSESKTIRFSVRLFFRTSLYFFIYIILFNKILFVFPLTSNLSRQVPICVVSILLLPNRGRLRDSDLCSIDAYDLCLSYVDVQIHFASSHLEGFDRIS